ncbi:Hypothetical protein FKW44_000713 [Caligus rogercresseyi]|uniref:Uncharacterized protein n=1 Tax=Caligus rogercresseyi TaxID=217165 RepID=A0A7T8QV34_CALRO|nr:Hypothetical protein FKW44_000713 [Caligus rogercresseyi]
MAFPDFPFSSHNNNNSSFLTHAQVLSYLKDYAANILQYIQACKQMKLIWDSVFGRGF